VGDEIRRLVRTLLLNGFSITSAQRSSAAEVLEVQRTDDLGAQVRYVLLIATHPQESITVPFLKRAEERVATPIGIGEFAQAPPFTVFSLAEFYRVLGGAIDETVVYEDDLPALLDELGHNRVPPGLTGKADDLLEDIVKQCFQFSTGRRSRRYGKDRLFEPVPDGIVLDEDAVLYDTKAYAAGFSIEADDVKRFAGYVDDFNTRYRNELGSVHSFVLVTGHFTQDASALESRRSELYSRCHTQLTCVSGMALGEIVRLVRAAPGLRRALDWKRLFSALILTPELVDGEIKRVQKDGVK